MRSPEGQRYLEAQVQTATKEQLMLMLFDGAIRFAGQARAGIEKSDFSTAYTLLKKAQNIVLELICSMDRKMDEQIYSNLCSLYKFAYIRLVNASLKRDAGLIDEALAILNSLRETWSMAMEDRQKEATHTPALAVGSQDGPIRINVEG